MGLFDKAKELFSDGGIEITGQLTPPVSRGLSKGLDVASGHSTNYHYYLNVIIEVASRSMSVSKEIEVTVTA